MEDKQTELDALRRDYDAFVDHSKELEEELEKNLKLAEKALEEALKKGAVAEEKRREANDNYSKLMKDQERLQQDLSKAREKCSQYESEKVGLEQANNDLQQKVRILEGTEEDLKHKLENAQEDVIFIQGDLEDLKKAKEDSERDLRSQLFQLQHQDQAAALSPLAASATPSSKRALDETARSIDFDSSCETVAMTPLQHKQILDQQQENTEFIEELEAELKVIQDKLAETEKQNEELNEELNRANDDLIDLSQQRADSEAKLKADCVALQKRLEQTIEDTVKTTDNTAELKKAIAAEREAMAKQLADAQKAAAAEKEALQKQISDAQKQLASLQASGSDAAAQLSAQLADKDKAIAAEREAMAKQLADAQKAAAAEKEALQKHSELLASSLTEAVSIADGLSVQRESALAETITLQAALSDVSAKSGQLSAQLFETGMQFASEKEDLLNKIKALSHEHSEVNNEIERRLESEKDALQKQVAAMQISADKAAALILKLEERVQQHAETEAQLAVVESELQQRSQEEERHAAQIESLTQLLQGKSAEMEAVQERLVRHASEVASTHQELVDALEQDLKESQDKIASTERDRNVLLSAIDRHGEQLEAAVSAASSARSEIQSILASAEKDKVLLRTELESKVASLERNLLTAQSAALTFTRVEATALATPQSPSRLNLPAVADVLQDMASSHPRAAAERAMRENDTNAMKAELSRQLEIFDAMRSSNALLLGKLQVFQGTIQVCCRTRPPSDQELAQGGKVCVDADDEMQLQCYDHRGNAWRSFTFDHVWRPQAGQWEVFADVEPLLLNVIDGFNVCILAYGQTGSGKTYTMNGNGSEYGVSYRTLNKLFELLAFKKAQKEAFTKSRRPAGGSGGSVIGSTADVSTADDSSGSFSYVVQVSMLEIYNETVKDLLVESPHSSGPKSAPPESLEIRQSPDGSISVPGLKQLLVYSLEDVMQVFARGTQNRATAATNLNEHSSRSHCLLIVEITVSVDSGPPLRGKLCLVDLAGSEKVKLSGVVGSHLKEAQHINKSLAALGDVMEALDSKSKHVPYRNSKLTYLLQDSLGGAQSRTMMIFTICPTDLTLEESLFTLNFSQRVRNVQMGPLAKKGSGSAPSAANTKNLEDAVRSLKVDLAQAAKTKKALDDEISDLKKGAKKAMEDKKSADELQRKLVEERQAKDKLLLEIATLQRRSSVCAGCNRNRYLFTPTPADS